MAGIKPQIFQTDHVSHSIRVPDTTMCRTQPQNRLSSPLLHSPLTKPVTEQLYHISFTQPLIPRLSVLLLKHDCVVLWCVIICSYIGIESETEFISAFSFPLLLSTITIKNIGHDKCKGRIFNILKMAIGNTLNCDSSCN